MLNYKKSLILAIFFLSGASGLIYEIVWTRQLSLVFGVSSFAVSTVLTVFMAGLGIGGYIFGRIIDKRGEPLKVYAALELFIGLYAVLLPHIINLSEWLYIRLQPPLFPPFIKGGDGGFVFFLLSMERFAISFFILIFPTIMMGGTLPVISRFLIRNEERIGPDAGVIYSMNTFGAVAGCMLTGFYLIENIGVTSSLYSAAALNFIAAGGAYIINQKTEVRRQKSELKTKDLKIVNLQSSIFNLQFLVLLAFGFSGMAALSYEVLWTRVLILILDNTIYAFSIILFTFLLGIAGGSLIFAKIPLNPPLSPFIKGGLRGIKGERGGFVITLFAIFQILIGLMGVLSLLLFANHNILSSWLNSSVSWASHGFASLTTGFIGIGYWWEKLIATFLMSFLIMIIPTIFMGASFPAAVQTLKGISGVGEGIGRIYLVNTAGAIIGSFSAGFILLPLIGIQKAIILTGTIPIAFGILILLFSPSPPPLTSGERRKVRGGFIRYAIPLLSLTAGFIILVLTLRTGDIPRLLSAVKTDIGSEVLYYKEGIAGTVLISSQETDLTPYRKPVKIEVHCSLKGFRLISLFCFIPILKMRLLYASGQARPQALSATILLKKYMQWIYQRRSLRGGDIFPKGTEIYSMTRG
ncbi:MAG: fused MFS/spermidine synthase [Nitrospinae bacterium]|nr:fused MFS/spermidine synthase [Nitrospinota bacterium]